MDNDRSVAIEPLAPELWFERLGLLEASLSEKTKTIECALRHCYHLAQLAPGPVIQLVGCIPDESAFEELLEHERYRDAAERIASSDFFDLTVNVPDGHAVVKVSCPIFSSEAEAVATEASTTILLAWLRIMLEIQKGAQGQSGLLGGPALHTPQSERHRRSTPH
ncbi:hypothetical protein [Aurantiacibacter rhizosphaerae]|uniref:hypothetical protein n=1 Tax=Aurantiacibacter rhizosphaerae TaxID=2691582 RepID=UPI0019248414|nr:hypothetical protein [Aurantiacibacter rhizosphaerae]